MTYTTLNTLIHDLMNIIRGSTISASEPISERQVEAWIHQYRAKLIKQDLDKKNYVNPDFAQTIPMVAIETAVEFGVTVERTTLDLPNTINRGNTSGYSWIGTLQGKELQLVPEHRAVWQENKRYTPNDVLVYLRGSKLYLSSNPDNIEHITVRGVFENPMEVGRFINPETSLPYTNIDSTYPIPVDMISTLKEMILSRELKIQASTPSDTTNDSSHGVSENVER